MPLCHTATNLLQLSIVCNCVDGHPPRTWFCSRFLSAKRNFFLATVTMCHLPPWTSCAKGLQMWSKWGWGAAWYVFQILGPECLPLWLQIWHADRILEKLLSDLYGWNLQPWWRSCWDVLFEGYSSCASLLFVLKFDSWFSAVSDSGKLSVWAFKKSRKPKFESTFTTMFTGHGVAAAFMCATILESFGLELITIRLYVRCSGPR